MTKTKLTDLQLFEEMASDNMHAFNELFERHWSKVYAVAFRYVKDESFALEIAHDIFVNIWNKRKTLQIDYFGGYVATAASYHGIRKSRQMKTQALVYLDDYQTNEIILPAGSEPSISNLGEQRINEADLSSEINNLLEQLPKRCREVYLLSRQEQLNITEIAERLGISKRTVENQLTTALKHIRNALTYSALWAILFQNQ
ncbi:RNA polymerase sigma factor [Pedobacter rhizosphaerae]|uniref:RNA polymerase sigma-70 factor, ECF subfamily n=1 Tax=Pedobacter rhizosphaerae TaxID=390241 RepID=A0A1H9K9B5_9SPHI|nr:sigma-70 family RNA polymerase sigma factor [Pedobacter rhizosphaerae]SEQ95658.1 RNA polymerase sigma-70 factor, ECF subfamily [Pedobacter rhizosphaerae]